MRDMNTTQELLAQLILGLDKAMDKVAQAALAAGATPAEAEAAAFTALHNHLKAVAS